MKIFDISIPITPEMVVWPGDPLVEIKTLSTIENNDQANVSQISMSVHTGTHIDAPSHFLQHGKTIDQLPLEKLIGKVLVMAFEDRVQVINEHALKSHPVVDELAKAHKVLFKTSNSSKLNMEGGKFFKDYVGINTSGAHFLAALNLDLIGVDYLSVASFNETEAPHRILLEKEIVLLEGINLQKVPPGCYDLYCLPIPIKGHEGAPARTILLKN